MSRLILFNVFDVSKHPGRTLQASSFKFSITSGWRICCKILQEKLLFGPHDYQLDGIRVTHASEGQDVIAILATESGKSAYIYMLATVLLALAKNSSLITSNKRFSPFFFFDNCAWRWPCIIICTAISRNIYVSRKLKCNVCLKTTHDEWCTWICICLKSCP